MFVHKFYVRSHSQLGWFEWYSVLFMLMLFAPIFKLEIGFSLKYWMLLLPIAIVGCGYKNVLRNSASVFFGAILIIIFSIPSIFYNLINLSYVTILYVIALPVSAACAGVSTQIANRKVFELFSYLYIFMNIVYGLVGLFKYLGGYGESNELVYGIFIQHLQPRLSGLVGDPNILAFYFSVIYIVSLRYRLWLISWISLIIIALTMSRAGFVFLLFCLLRYVFLGYRSAIVLASLALGLLFFLDDLVAHGSIDIFLGAMRIGEDSSLSSFGGRSELWNYAYLRIIENPIFGVGLGMQRDFFKGHLGTETFAHSTFLEIILEMGLVFGSILIGCTIAFLSMNFFKKVDSISLSSILILCVFPMSLSLLVNEVLWFFLLFCLLKPYRIRNTPSYM